MTTVILFDLFGTLVEKEEYDYNKALRWLSEFYFDRCFEEIQVLSKAFKTDYIESRKISLKETSFFNQIKLFEEKLNKRINCDYYNVELKFLQIFRKEKIKDGAIPLLEYLKKHDYKIYVLTNSLFSGESLKNYLEGLGLAKYIEKVYSSADIGFRKPSPQTFYHVRKDLHITNTHDIFFIGDSLEKDYFGAKECGFIPVLLDSESTESGLVFENLHQLLKYLECTAIN